MKTVSLKIDASIFKETEKILSVLKKPRNRYINEALMHYNKMQNRQILQKQLEEESEMVKAESVCVSQEFDQIEFRS